MIGSDRTYRTNLCTNPVAAVDTTGWTNTSLTTFERVTSLPTVVGLPASTTTGFHAVGDAASDRAQFTFTSVSGFVYRGSAFVRLASNTATGVRMQLTGTSSGTTSGDTLTTTGGGFTLLEVFIAATAAETITCRLVQVGAGGVDFHFTRCALTTRSPRQPNFPL